MMNSSPSPQLTLHVASIRRIARALSIDAAEADDVTQEVLVAALEGGEQAQDLPAWLAGAARNFARSRNRSEFRRQGREEDAARSEAQPSAGERAAQLEVAEQLLSRVRELSDAQAEVVWLRFWEDLPPRDIAKRLGIGVDTVKTRLKRGLNTLRNELDADTPGGREAWLGSMARLWIDTSGKAVPLSAAAAGLVPALLMIKKAIFPVAAAAILVGIWIVQASEPNPDGLPAAVAPESDTELASDAEGATLEEDLSKATTEQDEQRTVVASDTSLEVRVVREFDGAPLPGIVVSVIEHGRPESVGRRAVADADGYLRFGDLAPGRVTFVSDRGAEKTIERTEGRQTLEFPIPLGVRVTGRVLDPSGIPVAGAELVLQQGSMVWEWTEVTSVGTTDAEGRFDLMDVHPQTCIGARARGFAPSALEELEHIALAAGDDVDITLELAEGSGFVWAIVQTREGNPVAGAKVWVVERRPWRNTPDGSYSTPGGRVVRSASDGSIRVDGLGEGSARIVVDAEGFGLESTSVSIQQNETEPSKVVLSEPSAIDGVVLGPDGRGIPNVGVRLLRNGGTSSQDHAPFRHGDTRTDADGAFTFERMSHGNFELIAFVKGRPHLEAEGRLGVGERQEVVLRAEQGGDILTGRAVALDGTPLGKEMVYVTDGADWKSSVSTQADGTFRIEGAPTGPLEVHFYPVSQGFSFPAVSMTDVSVEDSPIEIVWEGANRVGDVRGDFVDTAEWGTEGDRIDVQISQRHVFRRNLELEGKRFQFEDVPAGKDYRVTISSRTKVLWSSELFEVVEGRTTDLGSIETEAPASVHIALEGEGIDSIFAELRNEALGWRIPLEKEEGALVASRVPAGSWVMNLGSWGQESAAAHGTLNIDVAAGEEWSTTYTLVSVPVTFLKFEPEFRPHHREVFVHTTGGELVSAQTMVGNGPKGHPVALHPGDYVIEIRATREGRVGRAQFSIQSGAMSEALKLPIEITTD